MVPTNVQFIKFFHSKHPLSYLYFEHQLTDQEVVIQHTAEESVSFYQLHNIFFSVFIHVSHLI